MKTVYGGAFDPETIDLLRSVLDEAWGSLRREEQAHGGKSLLAAIILKLAATGERDPIRLRTLAVTEVSASEATIAPNEYRCCRCSSITWGHASITNTVRYTAMSPEPFKDTGGSALFKFHDFCFRVFAVRTLESA